MKLSTNISLGPRCVWDPFVPQNVFIFKESADWRFRLLFTLVYGSATKWCKIFLLRKDKISQMFFVQFGKNHRNCILVTPLQKPQKQKVVKDVKRQVLQKRYYGEGNFNFLAPTRNEWNWWHNFLKTFSFVSPTMNSLWMQERSTFPLPPQRSSFITKHPKFKVRQILVGNLPDDVDRDVLRELGYLRLISALFTAASLNTQHLRIL